MNETGSHALNIGSTCMWLPPSLIPMA